MNRPYWVKDIIQILDACPPPQAHRPNFNCNSSVQFKVPMNLVFKDYFQSSKNKGDT
jgi:hypothetical protein